MITRVLVTRGFVKIVLTWLVVAVAVLGLAGACEHEHGWSQEGGDSAPRWR